MYSEAEYVRPRRRVVTKPTVIQPDAGDRFVARRNQMYSTRAKAPTYTNMVPRTLAQTGVRAASGQMRVIKRLPQYHAFPASPIPIRSGRRSAQHSGLLWKILGAFVLLMVVGISANFALTSTAFRVTQVSVVGTQNALLIHNIQHMGMQGQNIFFMDIASLTNRIDLLPMVASANLEKQWPNQLSVTITERQPVLLWQTKQGTYSVDKDGVVIAPASETTGTNALMTVVDMRACIGNSCAHADSGGQIHPGVRLSRADIIFAMNAFASLPKIVGVTDFVLRYDNAIPATLVNGQKNLASYGSYIVESKVGWLAYLGGPDDANSLNNRLLELQQILAFAQQQQLNLATVDLRFGLRPVYTLKSQS
ncbi:MAG: hypothetical protein NVS4B7_02460 [Ktedonobacteraceae bacterium]